MTAWEINKLLAKRHSDATYVPECKMGAAGSRSLDGWALLNTWSPMTAIGYEVKVSRSDWLRDQKFESYRTCCHLFFVVAPKGVVQDGELPEGVGLLEPIGQGDGQRLVMRRKAVRGEPDPQALARVMAYILMWRNDRPATSVEVRAARIAQWRKWLDDRKDSREMGALVTGRMRQMLREAFDARNAAERQAQQLQDAADVLREMGICAGFDRWQTRRRIEDALQADADGTVRDLSAAIKALVDLRTRVQGVRDGKEAA